MLLLYVVFIVYEAGSVSVDEVVHFIESVYMVLLCQFCSLLLISTSPSVVRVFLNTGLMRSSGC